MDTHLMFIPKETDDVSGVSTVHVSYIIQNLIPLSLVNKERLVSFDEMFLEKQEEIGMLTDDVTDVAVGSSAEGLNMPNMIESSAEGLKFLDLSDLDILLVMNQYKITFNESERQYLRFYDVKDLLPGEYYALAETNNIHPGYVRLNRSNTKLFSEYQDREMLLLNFRVRHMDKMEIFDVAEVNGPALTIPGNVSDRKIYGKRMPVDKVLAMPCKEWPSTAIPCLKRFEDNGWLPKDLIQEIKDGGCHIVPVHHKGVEDKDSKWEWRISFATSERLIARTALTDVQKQAYVAIKALYHQKMKKLETLSSYHMKTVFFYTCERISESCWRENVCTCILFFLDLLIECTEKRYIPNFFIPENNLVDYLSEDQFVMIAETLKEIRINPLQALLSFFDDKYFDELGVKVDYTAVFAPIIADMKIYSHHHKIEKSLQIFKRSSMAIMVKFIEGNKYQEAVETAKCLHLFLSKLKNKNFEIESLSQIILSTVKKIENCELVTQFCNHIIECFKEDKSLELQGFWEEKMKEHEENKVANAYYASQQGESL